MIDKADYCNRCLVGKYKEEDESRSWDSDPRFRRVLDPLNAGQNAKARDEAEALAQQFPDFADVYVWWAKALLNDCNFAEAKRVLRDGLSKSKQKYPLLNLMGEVEWKSGSLSDAVYWWVQGLICQQTRQGFGEEVGAYLYLHHVADALGLSTLARPLRERVDSIRPGKIRLSPDAVDSLTASHVQFLSALGKARVAPEAQSLVDAVVGRSREEGRLASVNGTLSFTREWMPVSTSAGDLLLFVDPFSEPPDVLHPMLPRPVIPDTLGWHLLQILKDLAGRGFVAVHPPADQFTQVTSTRAFAGVTEQGREFLNFITSPLEECPATS